MLPTWKVIMYGIAALNLSLLIAQSRQTVSGPQGNMMDQRPLGAGPQSGKQGKVAVAPPVLAFVGVNNTGLYLAKDGTVMFVDNGVFSTGGRPLNLKCDPPKPGPINFQHCKAAPIPKCAK
jgi:hypothetical protein